MLTVTGSHTHALHDLPGRRVAITVIGGKLSFVLFGPEPNRVSGFHFFPSCTTFIFPEINISFVLSCAYTLVVPSFSGCSYIFAPDRSQSWQHSFQMYSKCVWKQSFSSAHVLSIWVPCPTMPSSALPGRAAPVVGLMSWVLSLSFWDVPSQPHCLMLHFSLVYSFISADHTLVASWQRAPGRSMSWDRICLKMYLFLPPKYLQWVQNSRLKIIFHLNFGHYGLLSSSVWWSSLLISALFVASFLLWELWGSFLDLTDNTFHSNVPRSL